MTFKESMKSAWPLIRSVIGEAFATFFFASFVYTVKVSITYSGNDVLALVTQALAIALGGAVTWYTFVGIAPAHFNPALTLSAMIGLKMNWLHGIFYICAQLVGAITANAMLYAWFENFSNLTGLVLQQKNLNTSIWHAMAMEGFATWIFCYVVYATAMGPKPRSTVVTVEVPKNASGDVENAKNAGTENVKVTAVFASSAAGLVGLVVGFTLGLLSLVVAGSSQGSYNPAITIANALLRADFRQIYIFLVPELLAPPFAVALYYFVLYQKTDYEPVPEAPITYANNDDSNAVKGEESA